MYQNDAREKQQLWRHHDMPTEIPEKLYKGYIEESAVQYYQIMAEYTKLWLRLELMPMEQYIALIFFAWSHYWSFELRDQLIQVLHPDQIKSQSMA